MSGFLGHSVVQRVMNSAARVVRDTRKFDSGLSRLLYDELHWLDVADRLFKLAVLMYRCLHGTAPLYMMNSCTQTADVVSRQHLRSASQRKMIVPRYRLDSSLALTTATPYWPGRQRSQQTSCSV